MVEEVRKYDVEGAFAKIKELKRQGKEGTEEYNELHTFLRSYLQAKKRRSFASL